MIDGLIYMVKEMEKKLREYMPEDEYVMFATEVAKEAFRHDVENMESCELKDFLLENIDKITDDGAMPDHFDA